MRLTAWSEIITEQAGKHGRDTAQSRLPLSSYVGRWSPSLRRLLAKQNSLGGDSFSRCGVEMSFTGSHLPFAFCIYMESGARSLIQYQFNFHGVSSVLELSSGEQRLNYFFSRANSETGEVLNALPVYSTWQMLVLVCQVVLQGLQGCAHSDEVTGRVLQGSKIGKRSLSPSLLSSLGGLHL